MTCCCRQATGENLFLSESLPRLAQSLGDGISANLACATNFTNNHTRSELLRKHDSEHFELSSGMPQSPLQVTLRGMWVER